MFLIEEEDRTESTKAAETQKNAASEDSAVEAKEVALERTKERFERREERQLK